MVQEQFSEIKMEKHGHNPRQVCMTTQRIKNETVLGLKQVSLDSLSQAF